MRQKEQNMLLCADRTAHKLVFHSCVLGKMSTSKNKYSKLVSLVWEFVRLGLLLKMSRQLIGV